LKKILPSVADGGSFMGRLKNILLTSANATIISYVQKKYNENIFKSQVVRNNLFLNEPILLIETEFIGYEDLNMQGFANLQ
jgi:hypothetical protein